MNKMPGNLKNNTIVEACIELSYGQFEGCLFAVELSRPGKGYYKASNEDIFKKAGKRLSVLDERDRVIIRKLASLDGAMIINQKGELMHFGATLNYSRNFIGHGKRHAFALGTTRHVPEVVCILASEEDRKIRAFRNGFLIAEIDEETKLPTKATHRVAELLTSRVTGLIVASGIAASILTLNPIPAIVTISGTQIIVYAGFERIKQFITGQPQSNARRF